MAHGVSAGSPVSAAVVGVADLEKSVHFYRDLIGLDAEPPVTWSGPDFEAHWNLPRGASARAVFLHAGATPAGRVLLLDFDAPEKKVVRAGKEKWHTGLSNFNFYTDDIRAVSRDFAARGFEFWSEPVAHQMTPDVGTPIEVVFEGPDGVLINLVELATKDPNTQIGKMRAFVAQHGYTSKGFTPISTTHHVLVSREKGRAFYENVLGMKVHIDEELKSPEARKFLGLGENRIWTMFVIGNHMFGKVATSTPLNFKPVNLVPRAVPPNIGYLAQTFVVPDLAAAAAEADKLGAEVFSPPMTLDIPGFGRRQAMILRNTGSGALQQIVQ